MRHWGVCCVLVCLLVGAGCSGSSRKAGLLNADLSGKKKQDVAKVEPTTFARHLDEYMEMPEVIRKDLRAQAEARIDYYERFEREDFEYNDAKKRFWYYRGSFTDRSTRGIGVGNSIVCLKDATGLDPSYAEAWGVLGNLLMSSGDPVKGREYLNNALEAAIIRQNEGDAVDDEIMLKIYQDRAWVLRDLALWDEGLKAVHEGLTFKRGDQDLVLIKGLLLAGSGQYSEANSLAVRMPPYEFKKVDYWHYGYSNTTSDFASRWIRSQALLAIGDYEMARHVLGDLDHREDQLYVPHMARFWSDVGLVAELVGEERGARYYALAFISRPYEGFYPWQGGNLKPLVLNVPDPRMPVYTSYGGKFLVGGSILTYAAYQMNSMSATPFEKKRETAAARALFALDIAERRNIRPAVCRAMRGRIYYSMDRPMEARIELDAAYEAFTAVKKVDAGTSLLRGLLAMGDGHNEEAVFLLSEAVEADEKLAAGWRTLGVLYARSGQKVMAEAAMDKALYLEPQSVSGLFNRGLLRLQEKRFVESISDLEKAYAMDPENHEIQRILQMAASSYRANGGDPSSLRLQVQEYEVVSTSVGPPVDLVADPAALISQLNAEIVAFFSVPDSIAVTLSPDDEVLGVLATRYEETGDPDVRKALALAYLDRGMNIEAQALLAPGWGVDLLASEEIMLLYVDRLLGQKERGDALAAALISGEHFNDDAHLRSLMNDHLRLPWWEQPMGAGHHVEGYGAYKYGINDTFKIDKWMGLNFNELRASTNMALKYTEPMLNRWFADVRVSTEGKPQASAVNGGTPVGNKKSSMSR